MDCFPRHHTGCAHSHQRPLPVAWISRRGHRLVHAREKVAKEVWAERQKGPLFLVVWNFCASAPPGWGEGAGD